MNDSARDMFGKVMSWGDSMIINGFELCTEMPFSEVEAIKSELESSANPKDLKVRLAKEIVAMFYGRNVAEKTALNFGKGSGDDIKEIQVPLSSTLESALMGSGLVSSKSELRRLLEAGAIEDASSKEIFKSQDLKLDKDLVVKIGKHRFLKITMK